MSQHDVGNYNQASSCWAQASELEWGWPADVLAGLLAASFAVWLSL